VGVGGGGSKELVSAATTALKLVGKSWPLDHSSSCSTAAVPPPPRRRRPAAVDDLCIAAAAAISDLLAFLALFTRTNQSISQSITSS